MTIKEVGDSAWEWTESDTKRGRGVRAFASTRRLIWSSWVASGDGIAFDDGFAQTFESYQAGDAPPFNVPDEVASALNTLMGDGQQKSAKKGGWFKR